METKPTTKELLIAALAEVEGKITKSKDDRQTHEDAAKEHTADLKAHREERSLLRRALGLPVNEPKTDAAE